MKATSKVFQRQNPSPADGCGPGEACATFDSEQGVASGDEAIDLQEGYGNDFVADMLPSSDMEVKESDAEVSCLWKSGLAVTGAAGLTQYDPAEIKVGLEPFDHGKGKWGVQITSVTLPIHWGVATNAFIEPKPVDGGNITAHNWYSVDQELAQYSKRQSTVTWGSYDSTKAHEMNHVKWYTENASNAWPKIEKAWLARRWTVGEGVVGAERMKQYLPRFPKRIAGQWDAEMEQKMVKNERNKLGAPEGPGYAAGQLVLDDKRKEIRNYAREKGWTRG